MVLQEGTDDTWVSVCEEVEWPWTPPDPPPEGITLPGCPGALYPLEWDATWIATGGNFCDWLVNVVETMTWNPAVGSFGAYQATWAAPPGGTDITMSLTYLGAFFGNGYWSVSVTDGFGTQTENVNAPCGTIPDISWIQWFLLACGYSLYSPTQV